ncbi:glycosyltransferase [Gilliamella sp. N-G2]|uniref:glycosyltransferase n=2 Tax=unclassified Gilliamella TaxID=2685620 RepID=UPI000A34FDCD|nr:glycosyltransferase [Gilliamella sp. N-G2]OTQ72989.1 hypothetical protein B6C99_09365 [Gilliamella sp. N-G2]
MNILPILSIIVSVYNTEKYLIKCLDSLINQTFKNIEIICVNDGSTDGSLKILEKYQKIDNRIKIISKINGGVSSARNIGIGQAKGEYITFVDSDDFIESDTYEKAIDQFNKPEVDLVYFSTNLIVENKLSRIQDERYFEHKYKGFIKLSNDVMTKMDVCAWNKVYKLSIIRQYNILFPEGLRHEDNPFFWSYGLLCDEVCFINDKFYNYLIRDGSIMSYKKRNQKNSIISHELDSLLCFDYLLQFVFRWQLLDKFRPVLVDLLKDKLLESMRCLPKKDRILALNEATQIVKLFDLTSHFPNNKFLHSIANKNYYKIGKINQLFLNKRQRLIGVWDADKFYILCFLGIKIKVKK